MLNLRAATREILEQVESLSGRGVQPMRDDTLQVFATLSTARHGAAYHVLRYKPTDEPVDYWLAYQAGFLVRLFSCSPEERYEFAPLPAASESAFQWLKLGRSLDAEAESMGRRFALAISQWALMNLRSLSIGMRIDQFIFDQHSSLRELQQAGFERNLDGNLKVIGQRVGGFSVPSPLLGMDAAYALFAERLLGIQGATIPYEAAGALDTGRDLLKILDTIPADAVHDRGLVDAWAERLGMADWYRWQPYQP